MRYADGHKQAVRERIVRGAAKALRKRGVAGIGIPALMKGAGLTHGGFYGHFKNRDALVAEAIRAAGAETEQGTFGVGASLAEALGRYLSLAHVDHPEQGCVVAALAAESARQAKPVRRAFGQVVKGLVRLVDAKLHPGREAGSPLSHAALRLSATMVGAVVLARAVDDEAFAERILEAARASAP